ncbi:hypothetical protein [Paraburkholderia sp. BR14320]|uniref:hypothetical protein n=1 Tax=unclassified Paraburkholderia TaxID=2615204 RepID=UPI0034CD902A
MNTPDIALSDRLMLAAGYLAGSEMPDCAVAVLDAHRLLFGELDLPSNALAAAIVAKLNKEDERNVEER